MKFISVLPDLLILIFGLFALYGCARTFHHLNAFKENLDRLAETLKERERFLNIYRDRLEDKERTLDGMEKTLKELGKL